MPMASSKRCHLFLVQSHLGFVKNIYTNCIVLVPGLGEVYDDDKCKAGRVLEPRMHGCSLARGVEENKEVPETKTTQTGKVFRKKICC